MKWFVLLILLPLSLQGQCRQKVYYSDSGSYRPYVEYVHPTHKYKTHRDTVVVLKPGILRYVSPYVTLSQADTTYHQVIKIYLQITTTRKCRRCEHEVVKTELVKTNKHILTSEEE